MSKASVASGLSLRPAVAADAPFLADLRNQLAQSFLSSVPATVGKTLELLASSLTYIFCVEGRPAGSFALYVRDGGLEFGRFMLEPSLRGNGYGRWMLEMAITEARRLGAPSLRLVTRAENAAARSLYEELGFLAGARGEPVEPRAVRMELRLD